MSAKRKGKSLKSWFDANPVEWCKDCNGTGADYDGNCRAVACGTCGGSGMIELRTPQPNGSKQERAE